MAYTWRGSMAADQAGTAAPEPACPSAAPQGQPRTSCNGLHHTASLPSSSTTRVIKPAFDDPSNLELLAKLQQLGSVNLTGDNNTISHHSMQLAVAMQQHYSNPGNPELQAATLDKGHVADLIEEAAK
ncbi:hypothetical protein HaLaN_23180, partial [Haematococcus lacustris]